MFGGLLILSLAPILVLLLYVWARDKYEREPFTMLLRATFVGALTVIPILFVEQFLSGFLPLFPGMLGVFWKSFVVAAFTEEAFKLLFLWLLIRRSKEFNEKFDGIVYAVSISLGFAGVENVFYVLDYGAATGWVRAFTAVPAHFLFGVTMGYYVGLCKFYPQRKTRLLVAALIFPLILHGVYDFILMANHPWYFLIFVPFIGFMWHFGLKKMKHLSDNSIFRNEYPQKQPGQNG